MAWSAAATDDAQLEALILGHGREPGDVVLGQFVQQIRASGHTGAHRAPGEPPHRRLGARERPEIHTKAAHQRKHRRHFLQCAVRLAVAEARDADRIGIPVVVGNGKSG
jgi:hypothetical protein